MATRWRRRVAIVLLALWAGYGACVETGAFARWPGGASASGDPAARADAEWSGLREQLPRRGSVGFFAGSSRELIANRATLRVIAAAIAQQATEGSLPESLPARYRADVELLAPLARRMFEPGGVLHGRPMTAELIEGALVHFASSAANDRSFPLAQFALAPLLLHRDWEKGLVLGQFPDASEWSSHPKADGLVLLRALDDERLLFEAR